MSKAFIVAGLGYGDEGKGSLVDALVRHANANLVIRYNGGPQAAHHVVLDDGRSHCFSQFGSGTLADVYTFLSRFVMIEPLALDKEAEHLKTVGISDPYQMLMIDPRCPVITPYHRAMNQLREIARGDQRHGSCGMGIGEIASDIASNREIIRAVDLLDREVLNAKTISIKARFLEEANKLEFANISHHAWRLMGLSPIHWADDVRTLAEESILISDCGVAADDSVIVFEGAQGILLDERHGFHPHTTWSNTTFDNAVVLTDELGAKDVTKIGVTRSYLTRHGAGPLVTEDETLRSVLRNEHNVEGAWQGKFRIGHLDLSLLRYASMIAEPNVIAVTHMDAVTPGWRVRTAHQPHKIIECDDLYAEIEKACETPIGIISTGPTARDKVYENIKAQV